MTCPTLVTLFACPLGCRCDCARGGPCTHVWEDWATEWCESGATQGSAVCSRCGMTAIAHDVQVLP